MSSLNASILCEKTCPTLGDIWSAATLLFQELEATNIYTRRDFPEDESRGALNSSVPWLVSLKFSYFKKLRSGFPIGNINFSELPLSSKKGKPFHASGVSFLICVRFNLAKDAQHSIIQPLLHDQA